MKVGVALGGGGVRGLAHVLALETIDSLGVKPAVLAGTSMGAIIGALYASGMSGKEIREGVEKHIITRGDTLKGVLRKIVDAVKWLAIVRPAWKNSGLLQADGFINYLLAEIHADSFEELKIPLHVTATDFHRGEAVVLDTGKLLPALLASMSIPGIFVPVEHHDRVLVDGGIADNLPYELLHDECDVTIAIDVAPTREVGAAKPPKVIEAVLGMFDILIEQKTRATMEEHEPTIYIQPRLVDVPILDFDKIEEVWSQARPAMEELQARLEKLLASR